MRPTARKCHKIRINKKLRQISAFLAPASLNESEQNRMNPEFNAQRQFLQRPIQAHPMNRSHVAIVVLSCLLVLSLGFIASNFTDIRMGTLGYSDLAYPPPETVKLPHTQVFGSSARFTLDITRVPGRPNEIKIKANARASNTWEIREWIQQGPGTFMFDLEGGKNRYFLDISDFSTDGHEVTSVTVSLRGKYISGPRP